MTRLSGAVQRMLPVGQTLAYATLENPVLVREFRTRMRGARTYWLLFSYTSLLSVVLALMYFSAATSIRVNAGGGSQATDLGRAIFTFVFVAQAVLVLIIAPALTSGAITVEREQESYELLATSPLQGADLVRGKLIAAVAFIGLLLTASLPLVSLSFLVGGVSPGEIAFSYLLILVSAMGYSAIGLFWSAALKSTAAATVLSYVSVMFLVLITLTPGGFGLFAAPGLPGRSTPNIPFQSLNPIMAVWRAVQPETFFAGRLPGWLSATACTLFLGLLIAASAVERLDLFTLPAAVWVRGYATALWMVGWLFVEGALFGSGVTTWTSSAGLEEGLAPLLSGLLVAAILITPIYNTGDPLVPLRPDAGRRYWRGLLPHRLFDRDMACGTPLLATWVLAVLLLIPLGTLFVGKGGLLRVGAILLPGICLCLTFVLGLAALGHFLSTVVPNRWAACILLYVAAILLTALPYTTIIPWSLALTPATRPAPVWQLLYVTPFEGLLQLFEPSRFRAERPPLLLEGILPVWAVTSLLYLTAAVAFALAVGRRLAALSARMAGIP